jgi:hypothetical protein
MASEPQMWRGSWSASMAMWPCTVAGRASWPRNWLAFGHGRSSYSREYKRAWNKAHPGYNKPYHDRWVARQKAKTAGEVGW